MTAPLWINADSGVPEYAANGLRQTHALPMMYDGRNVGARQGVRPGGNQLAVSIEDSTITVQPGVALVDPGLATTQGPYWVAIGEAEQHELDPADVSNPRVDIVVLRVYDHDEDASGERKAVTEYIAGTPDPSPTQPATPAGALLLATIDVPPAGGGAAAVTDRRVWTVAAGGRLPIANQTERDALNPWPGMEIWRIDLGREQVYDGTQWRDPGFRFLQRVYYTNTEEPETWTKADYPGIRAAFVQVKGGGGGSAGAVATGAGENSVGGGGGEGGYSAKWIDASSLNATETVIVGAGGTAGGAGGNGGTGGTSSFGAHLQATGGGGGVASSATSGSTLAGAGAGGVGSGGDLNLVGSEGDFGHVIVGVVLRYANGGFGGPFSASRRPSGAGNGGNGLGGVGYGSGGVGAVNNQNQPARTGGDGAPGIVVVDIYV